MNTPEQGFIGLIKELRAMGVKYNALMAERTDVAENDAPEKRSLQSIDEEIDDVLDLTMATARLLINDEPESPATEETTSRMFTVFGFYTDSGQRFVDHLSGDDPATVIQRVADRIPAHSISIVAIIAGEHNDLMEVDYLEDTDDWKGAGN